MIAKTTRLSLAFVLLALAACGGGSSAGVAPAGAAGAAGSGGSAGAKAAAPDAPGPSPVGHATFVVEDAARARTLRVELWYPAVEGARAAAIAGTALEDLEPAGARHDVLAALVSAAPDGCTRKRVASASDVEAVKGPIPIVAFSHCLGCARFDAAFVAERLASHGIAVVAPDHEGDTLWDVAMGTKAMLDSATLVLRAGDVRATLDAVLDGTSAAVPPALRGRFDASRVGVFGHSFGSLTTGLVLQDDPRPRAGMGIAAPMEAFAPTMLANVHQPLLFLLAAEDHSIGEVGNGIVRQNFESANPPARLVEVADAGHWSFTDICALTSAFTPGCGMATRQEKGHLGEPFAYLANDAARAIAASYAVAFFSAELLDDAAARAFLAGAHPDDGTVTVTAR